MTSAPAAAPRAKTIRGVPGSPGGRTLVIRRGLVANGDPRNIATFSNIPHFFLKAGLRSGLLHSGVVLRPEELRTRRFIWNALRPLTLDEDSRPPAEEWDGELSPLRLGLIGIDWERKGGPLLLDAASILGRMGYDVEVVALGPDPSRVPAHPSLRALGYVHKGREFQRFVEIARSFTSVACFLESRRPGSRRSYLGLGIPIITTAVGGIVDPKGAGLSALG